MMLTPRLALVAALCAGTEKAVDVGCDHAYLAIALAKAGAFVEASDLRPGPLQCARENVSAAGLEDQIGLHLCDGLSCFTAESCDTVIICGMGGETIAEILEKAPWTADGAHALVLQPQTRADVLRRFLAEHGYTVEEERLVREDERLYCVLRARGGMPSMGAENQYMCTSRMYDDPLFFEYLALRKARLNTIVAGKQHAALDTSEEEHMLRRLEVLANGVR